MSKDDPNAASLGDLVSAMEVLTEELAPFIGAVIELAVKIRLHQYWHQRAEAAELAAENLVADEQSHPNDV